MHPVARLLFTAILLGPGAIAADPQAQPGWAYSVLATGLEQVDNLALDAQGSLYATLELAGRRGQLVKVGADGFATLVDGLDRADGLFFHDGTLYLTEEVHRGRILGFDIATATLREIARLDNPEGIGVHPQGGLVVALDLAAGKLLHLQPDGGQRELAGGLNRPEGLVVNGDGSVLVAETGRGRVLKVGSDGAIVIVIEGLDEPDQLRRAADGSLWITEDRPDGRLLRYQDGRLTTVLDKLDYPQGMWFDTDGGLLLAEQGKDRILRVVPDPD